MVHPTHNTHNQSDVSLYNVSCIYVDASNYNAEAEIMCKHFLLTYALATNIFVGAGFVDTAKGVERELLDREYYFNIPVSQAEVALELMGEVTGMPIIFLVNDVRGIQLNAVEGQMKVSEAWKQLLANSELVVVEDALSGAIAIKPIGEESNTEKQVLSDVQNQNSKHETNTMKNNTSVSNANRRGGFFSNIGRALTSIALFTTSYWVSAQDDDEDDILFMSPFVVQTDSDAGYLVGNTLGATRTNVALKDLPFHINVISSELIEDTAAYDVDYAIDYLPGTAIVFSEFVPLYSIRGFVSSAAMRNGVRSLNKPDSVQIDRIEAVKGPAALLYGQTQPGGVINYITKQPQFTASHSANISVGNHDLFRSTVSSTGAIGGSDRIAYRIDAAYHQQGQYQSLREIERVSISPMFLIKLTEKTELLLSYNIQDEDNIPSGGLPLKPGSIRNDPNTDPRQHWVTELGYGHLKDSPFSYRDIDTTIYEAQLRHNFFDGLDLRLNLSNMNRDRRSIREGGTAFNAGTYIPNVAGVRNTAFLGDIRDQDRLNFQADLAWEFETGPISHQLVLGYEYNDENEFREQHWWAGSAELFGINPDEWPELSFSTGGVFVRFAYDVFDPESTARRDEFARRFLPKTVEQMPVRPNLTNDNEFSTTAYYANWQLTWNEDKGRILLGGRIDEVEHDRFNFATEGDPALGNVRVTDRLRSRQTGDTDHFSPQAGISYAVTDSWTLYALFSQSVNPRFGLNPTRTENAELTLIDAALEEGVTAPDPNTLPWGQLYDPETGVGYEAGFKYAPIDNSMGVTVAFYDIEKQDIIRSHSDPVLAAAGFQELSGTETSTGIDIDFYLNMMQGKFQVVGGYTYADTEQVTAAPGLPVRWAAEHQGSVWGNYKFDNGFSAGLGVTYIDDRLEDSNVRISEGYERVDARVGYKTTLGKFPTSFNLNIRNLFDIDYRVQRDLFGPPLEWVLSVRVDL